MRNTESAGRVTLGVGVNNEHRQATNREARRDVHSGRRLTNTALLVRNGNDTRVIGARECRALEHGEIAQVALDLSRQRGVVGTHVTPS